MNIQRRFANFIVFALLAGSGCSRAVKPEGIYTFHSAGIIERLELRSDGAFTQIISEAGRGYTNDGRWSIENLRVLKLRPFLVRFDTRSEREITPMKYSLYTGRLEQRGTRIAFDDFSKYFLLREGH